MITWTAVDNGNGVSGYNGHIMIGDIKVTVATIGWSVRRNDPKPYILLTKIPGWTKARNHETREGAEASAERILTTFAAAIRPPAPDMSEVRLAAENAHESGYPNARFADFLHGFQCAVNWLNRGRG